MVLKMDIPEKEWRVITDEIGPCEGGGSSVVGVRG